MSEGHDWTTALAQNIGQNRGRSPIVEGGVRGGIPPRITEEWGDLTGGEGGGIPPHNWGVLRNEKLLSYGKMYKKTILDGDFNWRGAHNTCDLTRFLNFKKGEKMEEILE